MLFLLKNCYPDNRYKKERETEMNRRRRMKKETTLIDTLKDIVPTPDLSSLRAQWQGLPTFHRRALMVLIPIIFVLLLLPSAPKVELATQEGGEEAPRTEVAVNTAGLSEQGEQGSTAPKTESWHDYTVQTGDTLAKVFRANQLPIADLNRLIAIEGLDKPLSKIKQGQLVRFKLDNEGKLDILQLEKQGKAVMFFRLSDGGFGRSK
jgi:cell envelope opacity-associated protein A